MTVAQPNHLQDSGAVKPLINSTALELAAKRSYEYEGVRRGILYVGWEDESDEVREQWRRCVLEPLNVYLTAIGAP